jgi:integrase
LERSRFGLWGKWISLKTPSLKVAQSKLKDEKQEAQISTQNAKSIHSAKMTVGQAIEFYKKEIEQNVSTQTFYLKVLAVESAVSHDKLERIAGLGDEKSNSRYVQRMGYHRNPIKSISRTKVRRKPLEMPSKAQFQKIVELVEKNNHRTAKDSAIFIRFLAFAGCRKSEATRVSWKDVDLKKQEITILGDPATGTKNWEIHHIPMIPECLELLQLMKKKVGRRDSP